MDGQHEPPDWRVDGVFVPPDYEDPAPWEDRQRRRRPFPRRMIASGALLLAAIGAVTVATFLGGHAVRPRPTATRQPSAGASRFSAAQPPAITSTQAGRVLAAYWQVKNQADELRSDSLAGTIEAGASYRIDIGAYRFGRVADPANHGYVAVSPVHTRFYIPRLPTGDYPRWFVAAVGYTSPARSGYVLFSQDTPGGAWKDLLEPDLLPGAGPMAPIAADAEGYATAVGPAGNAAELSVAPGRIEARTAAFLNEGGTATARPPGNLADLRDEAYWRSRLPAGTAVTGRRQGGPGPVFGLRTKDGGAVLFYAMTAQLSLVAPPGETFELAIPGYYSPGQVLASARVGYLEQFAVYDPPRGRGVPRIVADASGIVSSG